ncbi:NAD(P)/FAD-dependent oxidoreductase [Lichenibacterium ramalinae]|uniref:NADH:ubiquinone reductase (non-electrogenic) n=1 Tax=Lichenibacterium ramalinae TaxID=2316527 RepID=A0A4Q2R977_9HYPH|nr:NAD(P)/FAD-dependent oxidoreductase [Lichenibacterium ramalinae]RYB03449.1 NAD(P)/FAD-dependent oxidoreductase [Lichenibacterium ramalinae]
MPTSTMTHDPHQPRGLPRIVIIGAGFGGLEVVRGLNLAPAVVTVIDKTNHNLFQPLLYQVATAALAPSDIAVPVRSLFTDMPRVGTLMGEVTGVDTDNKLVHVKGVPDIPYDHLVLATGSVYSWFGHDDWARHAFTLKTLDQALALRSSLLAAFEWAESRTDPDEIRRLLTFVIVGGGPTGVEMAGAIAELAHATLARDFRRIRPNSARIVLCEGGPSLLAGFPDKLSAYARHHLEDLGVEVKTGAQVETVDRDGVVAGGERIFAANVLWAAGTAATPVAAWVGAETGKGNGIKIDEHCAVPGLDGVYAVGDCTYMEDAAGHRLPGVAPVAKQQGAHVAKVLMQRLIGEPLPQPFRYDDQGQLAMVGRSAAVADLGGRVKMTGLVGWLLWSVVHLFFLIGARNRITVYLNWVWAWLTYGRGARLITAIDPQVRRDFAHLDEIAAHRPVLPPAA